MLSFKKTLNPKPPKPKDVHVQWEDAPGAPPLGAFLTEQALIEAFSSFGMVVCARIPRRPTTQEPQSFAFVSFLDCEDAHRVSKKPAVEVPITGTWTVELRPRLAKFGNSSDKRVAVKTGLGIDEVGFDWIHLIKRILKKEHKYHSCSVYIKWLRRWVRTAAIFHWRDFVSDPSLEILPTDQKLWELANMPRFMTSPKIEDFPFAVQPSNMLAEKIFARMCSSKHLPTAEANVQGDANGACDLLGSGWETPDCISLTFDEAVLFHLFFPNIKRRGLCSTQNRSVANLPLQESSSRPSGYVDLASKLTDVLGCCYGWSAWHFSK
ncbi:REX3 [Symbiodinium microadriaticum]|nr:REX3 [Symbiodinium sp. KB8]CAE7806448.1 REX3 [Symbiodinium microadriaticum]